MATNQMRREAAKRKLANQQKNREERARRRKRVATFASIGTVVVVVLAAVGVYLYVSAPDTPPPAPVASGPDLSGKPVVPLPKRPTALPATVNCAFPAGGGPASKPVTPPPSGPASAQGTVAASLQTNAGPIGLTLDRGLAPCTVQSFVSLAKQGYFNNTPCHRLTTGQGLQVLQCGDPTGQGSGGPGYTVPDEVFNGLTYGRGLVAMANTGQPNTGGSQFFLIYGDAQLPPQYTVFGSIDTAGLNTVDAIAKKGENDANGPGDGAPTEPVTITTATTG